MKRKIATVLGLFAIVVICGAIVTCNNRPKPGPDKQGKFIKSYRPNYTFGSTFMDSTVVNGPHGIVVDRYHWVWVGSLFENYGIQVVKSNGDSTDFSPIKRAIFQDTAVDFTRGGCRGMAIAGDGNILVVIDSLLLKLHIDTGEGLAIWKGPEILTKPAVDRKGMVYIGCQAGGANIFRLDGNTLELIDMPKIDPPLPPSRGIEISADGTELWSGNENRGGPVYQYSTKDFKSYALADSIAFYNDGEPVFSGSAPTLNWGPDSTLWISGFDLETPANNSILEVDFLSNEIGELLTSQGQDFHPLGVAFDTSRHILYLDNFNTGSIDGYAIALNAPTPAEATKLCCNKLLIHWKDNSGTEIGYAIQRSADIFTDPLTTIATTGMNSCSWPDASGLMGGNSYYYRIAAYNNQNQRSDWVWANPFPAAVADSAKAQLLLKKDAFVSCPDTLIVRLEMGDLPLGDFAGTLTWDALSAPAPAVLSYVDNGITLPGLLVTQTTNQLAFNFTNTGQNLTGSVDLLEVRFTISGAIGENNEVRVNFTQLNTATITTTAATCANTIPAEPMLAYVKDDTLTVAVKNKPLRGDVDGNGVVDSTDAAHIRAYCNNQAVPPDILRRIEMGIGNVGDNNLTDCTDADIIDIFASDGQVAFEVGQSFCP